MTMLIDPTLLLRQIFDTVTDFALLTLDVDGNITSWNVGAERVFGYAESEVLGVFCGCLFTPEDRAAGLPGHEMDVANADGLAADFRWHLRKNGMRFWADGVMNPIRTETGETLGFLKILRDVTDTKLANDEIYRLASVDPLTNLANRAAFDRRLTTMLALAARGEQLLMLFMIDLDRFKEINDQLGHAAGDALLHEAARRIEHVSRESDVIARLGGDEFALLQLNPPSANAGGALAAKLLEALSRPYLLDGQTAQISASIGIAVSPTDASTADKLLTKADVALYQAKKDGRNGYRFFTHAMDVAVHRRNVEQGELRRVVAADEYWLEYQPIIDTASGLATSMEALLRFPGPTLSTYPAGYIVDMAKEIGLIPQVGKRVFRAACEQLAAWRAAGIVALKMAVNTCSKELLEADYLATMLAILHDVGLAPDDIEIELTERDAIELNHSGSAVIDLVRAAGFVIVLDDFGTGYSSLSYLRALPISAIKLDKSFLEDVPVENSAMEVAKAVIALAQALGLRVTAEGIETEAQQSFVLDHHCSALQGFLYAPAMKAPAATDWLRARHQFGLPARR